MKRKTSSRVFRRAFIRTNDVEGCYVKHARDDLKTIMTQNITKRQGKRKGKDTCDAFLCHLCLCFFILLSLSSLSLRSWKTNAKKKKRRKKAGDPRQRLMDLGSFFLDLFFSFFFSRSQQFLFFTRKETDRTIPFCRSVSPQRKEKERARREPQQRLYI